jgi:hypothetical protein
VHLPPELDSDVAPGTPTSCTTLSNKHHVNAYTTPYATSRLRPPPWPNNKYRNKHYYSTHTPASTTAKR